MAEHGLPWIELVGGHNLSGPVADTAFPRPPGPLCHALFAGRVRLKPFAEVSQRLWGWNPGALLEEALDRQRLFMESQHPADDLALTERSDFRTLALRYLRDPSRRDLDLTLLGKVCASTTEAASAAATEYWHELDVLFPYDYELVPVTSREEFWAAAGWSLLEASRAPGSLIEIRRFEGVLAVGAGSLFLHGNWRATTTANEQIWRAIAGCLRPVFFNMTLRPTILFDAERFVLAEMAEAALKAAADSSHPTIRTEAEWAAGVYAGRLAQLRHPYILQLHLVAPEGLPDFLGRAIGSALSHPGENGLPPPGCQLIRARTEERMTRWRTNLLWLEPDLCAGDVPDQRFARLRYLAGVAEAQTVFRLPFPPKGGIPGVSFAIAETIQ